MRNPNFLPLAPLLALASSLLWPAANLRAQSFDEMNDGALQAWRDNKLEEAVRLAMRAVAAHRNRWEGHHTLAQVQLELGQVDEAKASANAAKDLLLQHQSKLALLDDKMRDRGMELLAKCREALAAGQDLEASRLLEKAAKLDPNLMGLAELSAKLPPEGQRTLRNVMEASTQSGKRSKYVTERNRILGSRGKIEQDIAAAQTNPSSQVVLRIIGEADAGSGESDAARKAAADGQLLKALELVRASLATMANVDPEALVQQTDAAIASDDYVLATENCRKLVGNRLYRAEVRRMANRIADKAPERAVAVLVLLKDTGDGVDSTEAERTLREIYGRDAARAKPVIAQLVAAASQNDGQQILGLLRGAKAISLEDYQKAEKLMADGKKEEATTLLVQVVQQLERLGSSGPIPTNQPQVGKTWNTGCGTPMRFIPANGGQDYWIAERPPTRDEWRELMGETFLNKPAKGARADLVIDGITYHRAAAFCDLLTQRDAERLPPGYRYVVPTEAEYRQAMAVLGQIEPVFLCEEGKHGAVYNDAARSREIIQSAIWKTPDSFFRIALANRQKR